MLTWGITSQIRRRVGIGRHGDVGNFLDYSGENAVQTIRNPNLEAYRRLGFTEVEGWCSPNLFPIMDFFDSLEFNKKGGVCEIGIHHGRFFILLNSLTQIEDRSFAVDVFENQNLNVDNSGRGSKDIFKRNLALYDTHHGRNTTLVHADSTDSAAIGHLCETVGRGSIRYFSIDGGHTAKHTINDLSLANLLTSNSGLVIVDDILNQHWLGVIEGVMKYLLAEPILVPIAIGHNKLFLAKLSYHARYFQAADQSPMKTKVVSFLGTNVVAL
jgi:Methyltransferase domain